jgi:trans-aconitate methyltransferase
MKLYYQILSSESFIVKVYMKQYSHSLNSEEATLRTIKMFNYHSEKYLKVRFKYFNIYFL